MIARAPIVAVALAALLAGCSSSTAGTGSGGSGSKAKTLHMAFVSADTTQNPFQEMAWGALAAAQKAGNVDLSETAPDGVNGPQEVNLFQSASVNNTDGIAIETVTPNLFVRPYNTATGAGVPVIAVDSAAPPGTKVNTFVGNSNTQVGEVLGRAFVSHVPQNATGDVVLGNDIPGLGVLDQRLAGVEEVIKRERPKLTILGPFNSGSDSAANYTDWLALVRAHPNAIGFLGVGSQDGISLPLVERQLHRKFLAGSCDIPLAALRYLQQGYLFALSSPEHWLKGYIAMSLLIDHARLGKSLPVGWWNPGTLLITQANVAAVIAREASNATRMAYFKSEVANELAHPAQFIKPLADAN